ncbi:MAG: hypothetical protein JO340_06800 [Acidobacteriaceae bacterium]|nr:hypothetical protein [Acidobacteriaceae bacterium]
MRPSGLDAFRLPPLILHPFSGPDDTSVLMESSRASLALQGFLPRSEAATQDLDQRLLRGRYAELRMLYYIGKDVTRWTEQCAETASAAPVFEGRRMRAETFAVLLVQFVPAHVRAKLEGWGVLDFCSLFRRSFGLHGVFQELPPVEAFSSEFLRRYHRYLDQWYEQRLKDSGFDRPEPHEFVFDLYASGEYTMMLEQSWGTETGEAAS